MLYARVVLGLPVEGPFDYIVPHNLEAKVKAGTRVWVHFGKRKILGFVVGLADETAIKELKKISAIIDEQPILDKNMLNLTKEVSQYYCCSWGQAIKTALPEALKKGKGISDLQKVMPVKTQLNSEVTLVHSLESSLRWNIYIEGIKEAIAQKKSIIILMPDKNSALNAKQLIEVTLQLSEEPRRRAGLNLPYGIVGALPRAELLLIESKLGQDLISVLYRKVPQELEEWLKIREGRAQVVIGTRSAVFAPVKNLGLIIIEEEQNSVYKQEQVPHYNAREVAFMRVKLEKAKLILGSPCPSLESFYLAKRNKIKYSSLERSKALPEIKIIDMKFQRQTGQKSDSLLSGYLKDSISASLNSQGRILLFINRRGFATSASCRNCGAFLKCPRCNINLVFHFKENILNCHYCNYKIAAPLICPNCNSGYIRYSGTGTEKIESEISRIFVKARIKRIDSRQAIDIKDADIFVATSQIIKQENLNFDLIGIIAIDNSLNRIDFRSSEKAFCLLSALSGLTSKKIVIQTRLPKHICFQALEKNEVNTFYQQELETRRQLNFPPYRHIILVKLRSKQEERVKQSAQVLFERLNQCPKNKGIKVVSVNQATPYKLRDKFCRQVLIIAHHPQKASKFLKNCLKDFSHSGIITTVDVDPL